MAAAEETRAEGPTTSMDSNADGIPGVKTPGPKLRLEFTCECDDCKKLKESERRVIKHISKKSYEEGVVLVYCDSDSMHLIADNLCWFGDEPSNIETILAEKQQATVSQLQKDGLVDIV
jgi:hypothetical protein